MSSSAITTQVAQLKIGSVQNQADSSGVYSAGVWSFKNSTALTSVTISDSGNVGIGTASPTEKLYIDAGLCEIHRSLNTGNVTYYRLHHGGYTIIDHKISGNTNYDINNMSNGVRLVANGTSWGAISDERKKKNIKPLEYGLAQVSAIKPVRFDYKTEESDGSARVGFIAQELLPVIKEAVQGSEDTEYSVTPTDLIPVLVKAIQELSAKNEALEARLAALESK